MTSRRWAPVGKRLARPSYMVWPTVVVDRYGQRALTGELSHRLDVDQPVVLELAGQVAGLALVLDQGFKRDVGHHEERGGPSCPALGAPPVAMRSDEGVVEALVPASPGRRGSLAL